MTNKYQCNDCDKILSSYHSHWRHQKKSCKAKNKQSNVALPSKTYDIRQDEASFPSYEEQRSKPQLSTFVNTIINGDDTKKMKVNGKIPDFNPLKPIGPSSSEDEESDDDSVIKYPVAKRRKTVSEPTKLIQIPPHLNEDDDSAEEDESVCSEYLPPPIQFLPENKEDLFNRSNELFIEYTKEKRQEIRNELVAILDELKRRNFIGADVYRKLNDYLSGIPGSGLIDPNEDASEEMEIEEEEENEIESKISDTLQYLIQHDRNEIQQLLELFEKEGETYFEDDIEKLRELIENWIEEEIIGKENVLNNIKDLLIKLQKSKIPQSKLHRLEMILRDIRLNRRRVKMLSNERL